MPAAAITAATSVIGGIAQGSAAGKAAQAQKDASAATLAANDQLQTQVGNDVNPTIGFGNQAGGALAGLLGIGGNPAASSAAFKNYLDSTNYGFLVDQGNKSLGFLNAPNLNSGATGKALVNYNQGMAGNALAGYEGLLQGEQGLGLQGSSIFANTGTQLASQNAQARNLAAGAQGTAGLVQGGQVSNTFGSIGNLLGSSYGGSGAFGSFGGLGSGTDIGSKNGLVPGVFG